MSSRKFEPPLHIELVPSRWLLVLLLAIHIGAALLVVFFPITWLGRALLLVCLLASLMISLGKTGWIKVFPLGRRWLLRWQYIPRLTWQADNDWHISTCNGQEFLARLLPVSTCHVAFVALNFRTEQPRWRDRYLSVVICADAIDREIFRQLRVRLRTRFVQEQDN